MDLQTRKLNLISYLAQIKDENILEKIENFILNKSGEDSDFKKFTEEELIKELQKGENSGFVEKFDRESFLKNIHKKQISES